MISKDWGFIGAFARRTGKTTELVEVCRRLGGTLVCLNEQAASDVRRSYKIDATSIYRPERMRGRTGPVFFEPEAVALISQEYERDLRELRKDRDAIKDRLRELRKALETLRSFTPEPDEGL